MFFDWKIQLEKVQLTPDLRDDTIIYRGIQLLCKNDQGYCDPTTRTQSTIVWFAKETTTTFQVERFLARMIKFHQNYFYESVPDDKVNPEKTRQINNRSNNINGIENKLTPFQIYPETEFACKNKTPLFKTQFSQLLVEYEKGFKINSGKLIFNPNPTHCISNHDENSNLPVTFLKNTGKTGGKLRPPDKSSTRLQELTLMNNTYSGAINYDINLDMKMDYTISRTFQEMSLSELETLYHLCELERTQILQSIALAVLKIPYAGFLYSKTNQIL